eukprot:1142829-Pelagomonas_calceolata.AAC.1
MDHKKVEAEGHLETCGLVEQHWQQAAQRPVGALQRKDDQKYRGCKPLRDLWAGWAALTADLL